MPLDEIVIQKVKQWFEIAEEDFHLAEQAFTISSPIPYRLIAYHCQQAAEKYLKGFLVYLRIDFPYTHSIERLIGLLSSTHPGFDRLLSVNDLSDYAVAKRYPEYYQKISKAEAEQAFVWAEQVRTFVLSHVMLS